MGLKAMSVLIKCKVCGGEHAGTICDKFRSAPAKAALVAKVADIAARPVKEGSKGIAKKAARAKRTAKKQTARRAAAGGKA